MNNYLGKENSVDSDDIEKSLDDEEPIDNDNLE